MKVPGGLQNSNKPSLHDYTQQQTQRSLNGHSGAIGASFRSAAAKCRSSFASALKTGLPQHLVKGQRRGEPPHTSTLFGVGGGSSFWL